VPPASGPMGDVTEIAAMKLSLDVPDESGALSPRTRFRIAMVLAMATDALQIFVFPLFAEGAWSPAEDLLDFGIAAVLVHLLGWHWEFLPTFFAELVPGADLVPFWTISVLHVYRKWKQFVVSAEDLREPPALPKPERRS